MKSVAKWVLLCMALPFAFGMLASGQGVPAVKAVKVADKPSDTIQAKILKLQLQATRIQSQFQSCQQTDFQGQFNQASAAMLQLADQALAEAKLDKKEWELNLESFEFQKRATPVAEKK